MPGALNIFARSKKEIALNCRGEDGATFCRSRPCNIRRILHGLQCDILPPHDTSFNRVLTRNSVGNFILLGVFSRYLIKTNGFWQARKALSIGQDYEMLYEFCSVPFPNYLPEQTAAIKLGLTCSVPPNLKFVHPKGPIGNRFAVKQKGCLTNEGTLSLWA